MDEEDEIALKQINVQLPDGVKECSEDQFEDVIAFFEETAQNKQPFAAVDSPPVLPLEELEEQYDSTVPGHVRIYAKFIYEHWKVRRTDTGNRHIAAQLKGETGADTDDADPYVCFRRREARQVRKTRNRDAHSAEKLRTLRRQLEDARSLLTLVKQRESYRKQVLENEIRLFKQRAEVKETKRKLGIKGDDEDLVNQKVRDTHSTDLLMTDLACRKFVKTFMATALPVNNSWLRCARSSDAVQPTICAHSKQSKTAEIAIFRKRSKLTSRNTSAGTRGMLTRRVRHLLLSPRRTSQTVVRSTGKQCRCKYFFPRHLLVSAMENLTISRWWMEKQ